MHRSLFFCCGFFLVPFLASLPVWSQVNAVDPANEDPDVRRIIRLIEKLNAAPQDATLQAVEDFDVAWQLAVSGEDLLTEEGMASPATAGLEIQQSRNNIGARAQLKSLFAGRSEDFRNRYEETVGSTARKNLTAAVATNRISDLERQIIRFQFTAAGQAALKTLVQLQISNGNSQQAALIYRRLLKLTANQSPEDWLRLCRMLWQVGLEKDAALIAGQIAEWNDDSSLQIPTEKQDVVDWLAGRFGASDSNQTAFEWNQPGGSLRRDTVQTVGPPELAVHWQVDGFSTVECVDCIDPDEINVFLDGLRSYINIAVEVELNRNVVRWPSSEPLVHEDIVVFRGAAKIRAVHKTTGQLLWETTLIDPQLNAALEEWRADPDAEQSLVRNQYRLRNTLLTQVTQANLAGQLATDGQLLFAIEESSRETMAAIDQRAPVGASATNYLRAYDLNSGILRGEAGGAVGASLSSESTNPLTGMYFLGAPLVLGDRIFVLAESDQGIFLLQLKAIPLFDQAGQIDLRPVASQLLIRPEVGVRDHPVRKLAGLIPSYHNGLLICPTGDELVIAVSADDLSLQWGHRYESSVGSRERKMGIGAFQFSTRDVKSLENDSEFRWTDSLVRISGNRVYVTPRDSNRLLCLNADDGTLLWETLRGPYRCISIVEDQVLLVGLRGVAALDAETGEKIWQTVLDREIVAGRPVFSKDCIQLPTLQNGIISLSTSTGQRRLRQKLPDGMTGNLLATGDQFLLQTATRIASLGIDLDRPSLLNPIRSRLLAGDSENVLPELKRLRTEAKGTAAQEATELYLDTALDRISSDFVNHSNLIPELTQILDESSFAPSAAQEILLSTVGGTLLDSALFPQIWAKVDTVEGYRKRLNRMIAGGLTLDLSQSEQQIAEQLFEAVQAAEQFRSTFLQEGDTSVAGDRLRLQSVQKSLRRLPANSAEQIATSFVKQLQVHANSLPEERQLWWHQTPLHLGLSAFADLEVLAEATLSDSLRDSLTEQFLHQQGLVASMGLGSQPMTDLMKEHIESTRGFLQQKAPRTLSAVEQKTQSWLKNDFESISKDIPVLSVAEHGVFPAWLPATNDNRAAVTSVYSGTPTVDVSAYEPGSNAPRTGSLSAPQTVVPIFGQQGVFADFHLLLNVNSTRLQAFDRTGVLRWTLDLSQFDQGRTVGQLYQLKDVYAVVSGHLMGLKRGNDVVMLDCRKADSDNPPTLLWRKDLKVEFPQMPDEQLRTPYSQQVNQFDMRPAGLFPMGPLSQHGLPVLVGRELVIYETLTGRAVARIEGLSPETTITSDALYLLLISPRNNNVEVRRLLDGTLVRVVNLPSWWKQAEDNEGESVQTIELSPGDVDRYRLDVRGGRATFLNRGVTGCSISQLNLASGLQSYKYKLPVDTVASNVVDGHVALLCDNSELQLVNLLTGRVVLKTETEINDRCMYLYLKPSPDHWIVATSVYGDRYEDLNPVSSSFPINGMLYAIDRSSGKLSWSRPVEYQHLRSRRPPRSVHPSFAPILILHERVEGPREEGRIRGRFFYQAEMIDTRTGETLHTEADVGTNLSYHYVVPDAEKKQLGISYNDRQIVLQYE